MKYTYKYIEDRIDTRFYKLTNHVEILNLQKEIKGIHNQNRIALDFLLSNHYKDYSYYDEFFEYYKTLQENEKRPFQIEVFKEVTEQYKNLDKNLQNKNPQELTYQDLEPYIKLLPKHLDAMIATYTHDYRKFEVLFCRFGCNRLINGLKQDSIEYVLQNIEKINTLIEEGNDFETELDLNWHVFLTTCWTLIEGGVGEVSLYIADIILKLFEIQIEPNRSAAQKVFVALYRSVDTRSRITTLWIKALALIQLDRIEEAKQTLKFMIDSLISSNFHTYVLYNRMTEASILLYILEPTAENEHLARKLMILTAKEDLREPTETARERGLIIYDFCKHILKQDI